MQIGLSILIRNSECLYWTAGGGIFSSSSGARSFSSALVRGRVVSSQMLVFQACVESSPRRIQRSERSYQSSQLKLKSNMDIIPRSMGHGTLASATFLSSADKSPVDSEAPAHQLRRVSEY